MKFYNLKDIFENKNFINQLLKILTENFPEWIKNENDAMTELEKSLSDEKISIILEDKNTVIGWISGINSYSGAFELHPIVISKKFQGKGYGKILISYFEKKVKELGYCTIYLGCDDEDYRTNISGKEIFPDPIDYLINIKNINNHPYEFYIKCGFSLCGIIPHANGFGKPDILMAKKI
ncbi:MAG: GNAT family N-acetyltransferase [Thermotogae bacterium]|nr:GNAT family N-acetyltransferase [Thermotogota bacterium]MCP5465790.1 GNAT family N-acetyltransferase [Thermotogota bacterium]HOO74253.1 GNAT family N-acetyltransferase [Tepiditoga sp.]